MGPTRIREKEPIKACFDRKRRDMSAADIPILRIGIQEAGIRPT